ncbi:MAG: AP endonuclease [Betaproteobacteria bacterium RIFCSPLOWO2_12_FULL_63_13]|nr:MAG: AP endonuclease [Betaproteobacteria bacterium RIFCSPLOWO2_02_FULL_63_19]OGA46299.1 MAG: AP endonuclease [Betaproteobacteria bacterium RIFCSPLOWO2_12_FULL_63_13]
MRILSLAPLTVLELSPPDMVSCAARAGYSHLGLRLHPVMPNLDASYPIIGDTPMLREVRSRLADTGLKILDVEFIPITPGTRVADFVPMLETAAQLGAAHVLAGGIDPDQQRLAARFGELCDTAAPFGLTANLEPISLFEVRTLAQAVSVLAAVDRPNSGIVIDPIHWNRSGDTVEDIARVPTKWLHYMQLCDAPALRPADVAGLQFQARFERRIPDTGDLDLSGLLRALPRELPIALEVPMASLARTVGAEERARRLLEATRDLLRRLPDADGAPQAGLGSQP